MILRETPKFTVECDIDDPETRVIAASLVTVFSKYRLINADHGEPLGINIDGDRLFFVIRYKVSNA